MELNKIYQGDCLEKMKTMEDNSVDAVVTDPPYGLSFMGKKWDYDVPSQVIWEECLRVLKPGGYLLAFAGTRTQHRMAVRIEDAGFEIRDMIAWVYGSGFPKSLNIGKAVDKLQGNDREEVKSNRHTSNGNQFAEGQSGFSTTGEMIETKGTSEWEGWGTALKPALEPITVARKPLSEKTVAENALKWGTGGINIDGSRVGTETVSVHNAPKGTFAGGELDRGSDTESYREHQGRFPANLIHDGSQQVLDLFPNTKSGVMTGKQGGFGNSELVFGGNSEIPEAISYGDSGSASRFFYCAKASKSERNKGCEELEEKLMPGTEFRPSYLERFEETGDRGSPRARFGKMTNNHPTVKPIALMEYLVKLVSREGALVLDPFAGSGTTGVACRNLKRKFILIEKDEGYCKIAEYRLKGLAVREAIGTNEK